MQWKTAAYVALSIITVLVARSGPSRGAYWAAWLLFLTCIVNNCAWYMRYVPGASLGGAWAYSDAIGASLFTVLFVFGPSPRKWAFVAMIVAYLQLIAAHPLYEFGVISRWWYAFALNRGFEITALAIMTPAIQNYLHRKRRG